jgi:hypothetical protein
MTGEWIKIGGQSHSMNSASRTFGQALDHNIGGLIQNQRVYEGRLDVLKSEQRKLQNTSYDLQDELKSLEPYLAKAHRLKPQSRAELMADVEDLENRMLSNGEDLKAMSRQIEHAAKREMEALGGGLPSRSVVKAYPFSVEDLAFDLNDHIKEDGFYALHVHSANGPGHVMGIQVKPEGCKFMDPNTGEFAMTNRKDMLNLVGTAVAGGYPNSTSFSLDHFRA